MTIWAIADLHLSFGADKPMDIFGVKWEGHAQKIENAWRERVGENDTTLIAGDISWGMTYEQALPDLEWIDKLPGKKIIIRGNHDYWWKGITFLRQNLPPSIYPLQNDHIEVEGRTVCGSRGWAFPIPGSDSFEQDTKLFARERLRLEMSIDSAKEAQNTIVMMHYPPFLKGYDGPDFTDILEAKQVSAVVYGHLHDRDIARAFTGNRNGIEYYFTACDGVGFAPVEVE